MTLQLHDEDRRAVDLVLDGQAANPQKSGKPSAPQSLKSRIQAVLRILNLLNRCPATDPPADLTLKTMQKLDQAILTASQAADRAAHAPTGAPGTGT